MSPQATSLARRVAGWVLVAVVALAALYGLQQLIASRDSSNIDRAAGPGALEPDQGHAHLAPGTKPPKPYASDPPTSGPHVPVTVRRDRTALSDDALLHALELGNVVLFYGSDRPPAALVRLQSDASGPFDPALVAAGGQVILAPRPGVNGVIAVAWRRLLHVPAATDPQLSPFVDAWLGRGAGG